MSGIRDEDPTGLRSLLEAEHQLSALSIGGTVTCCITLFTNVIVVLLHFLFLWYQASMVNRVSLRLIVFSCLCNVVYTVMKLVAQTLPDNSLGCRVLVYFVITTDTMATMCLAMVGLNLVIILVVQVVNPRRLEKYYYTAVAISAILVAVAPLAVRKHAQLVGVNCWSHYYFVGRYTRTFKWASCRVKAFSLATVSAAIAIYHFARRQDYFVGTVNMTSRRSHVLQYQALAPSSNPQQPQKNTVVFRKVVIRCLCYPLIPLVSKVWGVSIEISIIRQVYIPFAIYVLDGIFSNLLGFMVSCIYFSDPSVVSATRYILTNIKRRYVDEYYCIHLDGRRNSQYDVKPRQLIASELAALPKTYQPAVVHKRKDQSWVAYVNEATGRRTLRLDQAVQRHRTPETLFMPAEQQSKRNAEPILVSGLKSQRDMAESDKRYGRRFTEPSLALPRIKNGHIFPDERGSARAMSDTGPVATGEGPSSQIGAGRRISAFVRSFVGCSDDTISEEEEHNGHKAHHCKLTRSLRRHFPVHCIGIGKETYELRTPEFQNGDQILASRPLSPTWNQQRAVSIEPYAHPLFAMALHWILVNILRVPYRSEAASYFDRLRNREELISTAENSGYEGQPGPAHQRLASGPPSLTSSSSGTQNGDSASQRSSFDAQLNEGPSTAADRKGKRPLLKQGFGAWAEVKEPKPFDPAWLPGKDAGDRPVPQSSSGTGPIDEFLMMVSKITGEQKDEASSESVQVSQSKPTGSVQQKQDSTPTDTKDEGGGGKLSLFHVLTRRPSPLRRQKAPKLPVPTTSKKAAEDVPKAPKTDVTKEAKTETPADARQTESRLLRTFTNSPDNLREGKIRYGVVLSAMPKSHQRTRRPSTRKKTSCSVERPPSLLAEDVGIRPMRKRSEAPAPVQDSHWSEFDAEKTMQANQITANLSLVVTKAMFVTSWEQDERRPRIQRYEEPWGINSLIDKLISRANLQDTPHSK